MLNVNDKAPDFAGTTVDGKPFRLSDLRGKRVVIYFFPRAFTPGCTVETRRFRDNYDDLKAAGAEVIGISVDPPSRQCDFQAKERVRFPMVGDPEHQIAEAYDVLRPLLRVSKRVTYVVSPEGTIEAVFQHEFQVSKHLDDVLRHLSVSASNR